MTGHRSGSRAAPFTVLVADDEPAARRGVRQLLAAFPEFTIVGECRDGREVLAALDTLKPDVIFLDIQMPEVDGFEVIRRRTPARMPATVFLTAYDRFAIRAFEAEAHDYLVKPVSEARFAATIARLIKRLAPAGAAARREPPIVVATSRGALVLRLQEIDWIEAADNYARIWSGGRGYLLRESLGDLERRVGPHGFARAHRQALVRIGGVRALRIEERTGGSRIDEMGGSRTTPRMIAVLSCGTKVPISRRRRAAFSAAVRALHAGETPQRRDRPLQ
ncbi:MAG TPA: LytTR family DNA-binding domain-containing protein [Vicinamibacterales bacterium]|nr:LytTR family DNA-binding domain-containing protein [Vicinamibacterales bacterium]